MHRTAIVTINNAVVTTHNGIVAIDIGIVTTDFGIVAIINAGNVIRKDTPVYDHPSTSGEFVRWLISPLVEGCPKGGVFNTPRQEKNFKASAQL